MADVYPIQYGFCNLGKMFLTLTKIAVAFHVTQKRLRFTTLII